MTQTHACDVLVVGGGPAGCAAAYWAARAGHDVLLVERATHPRERVCGDALTPGAVGELTAMGCDPVASRWQRHVGLRMTAHGRTLQMRWPADSEWPDYGAVVRRPRLDALLAARAEAAGAQVWTGTEVTAPLIADGHLRGGRATGSGVRCAPQGDVIVRARYVVIADGPRSEFGRALGTARTMTYAQGLAMRAYYPTAHHHDEWIEAVFALTDQHGNQLPGYGWVFGVGDGTANVGVGLLSHHYGNEAISLERLFEQWTRQIPQRWEIDVDGAHSEPVGGRLPMGGSVRPRSGPNWVVVGDAAGSVNPWSGDGICPALRTGRLAAEVIGAALESGDALELRRYETELTNRWQRYHQLGRLTTRALGRPGLTRRLTQLAIRSPQIGNLAMRVSTGLLRSDAKGSTERIYRAAATGARLWHDRS